MNPGDRLSDKRSPFMKEMTTIDGAIAYTMWEGNCDAGKLDIVGASVIPWSWNLWMG
jgi:hypothetical protein